MARKRSLRKSTVVKIMTKQKASITEPYHRCIVKNLHWQGRTCQYRQYDSRLVSHCLISTNIVIMA